MRSGTKEITRGRIYREALGIIVLALAVFALLSLVSYDPVQRGGTLDDAGPGALESVYRTAAPGTPAAPEEAAPGNLCGPVGRFLAANLFRAIGAAAYLLVGLVTSGSVALLLQRRFDAPAMRLTGGLLLLVTFATAATFLHLRYLGGWLGAFFYAEMQTRFSLPGSYILLASAGLIGLLLTTDFLPLTAAWKAIRAARRPAAAAEATLRENSAAAVAGGIRAMRERWLSFFAAIGARLRRRREESAAGTRRPAKKRPPAAKGRKAKRAPAIEEVAAEADDEEEEEEIEEVDDEDEEPEEEPAPPPRRRREPKVRTHRPPKAAAASSRSGLRGLMGGGVATRLPAGSTAAMPAGLGPGPESNGYRLPPLDLLEPPHYPDQDGVEHSIREISAKLESTLRNFKVEGEVVEIDRGPVITLYEVELAAGIKVQKVVNLADDLAMALKNRVRIVAPIPGKSTVGIEVPNKVRETVCLGELAMSEAFQRSMHSLPFLLGKDASGAPVIEDLAQMPHLLIAGATGSGKSICINSIIMSILLSRTPDQVQMILIDPKMVELSLFKKIPHLLTPVVTDMKRTPAILEWAVSKMEERYALLADMGVKNITGFNELGADRIRERAAQMDVDPESVPNHLPYIVIMVDELADLMMIASKEIENSLTRLAQKSRAVGIHIIFATQRPSVDVITGLIKANFPARLSFRVSSRIDSRTILDGVGAERLLGQGDLLYLPPRSANLMRCQGVFVSEKEIRNVVQFLKRESEPRFNPELENLDEEPGGSNGKSTRKDPLFEEAVRFILETNRGSVSLLQRRFEIGYSRAARLVDQMAEEGIVGKYKGSKAREVMITLEEWEARTA
jgi:S-DNA-T family DNA segregation ATPase FtsK/SpoIIIE